MYSEEKTPRPIEGLQTIAIDDSLIIVEQKLGVYYGLNEVGTSIWRLLEAGTSTSDIISSLCLEYNVSAEIVTHDLARILKEIRDAGLLQEGP